MVLKVAQLAPRAVMKVPNTGSSDAARTDVGSLLSMHWANRLPASSASVREGSGDVEPVSADAGAGSAGAALVRGAGAALTPAAAGLGTLVVPGATDFMGGGTGGDDHRG